MLDTSVLIHDPYSLERFEEHEVCIPAWVVDELDGIKTEGFTRRGRAARIVSPLLEKMYDEKRLSIEFQYAEATVAKFMVKNSDLFIMLCAKHIQENNPDKSVILVSKDFLFRLKAKICGLTVEDYKNDKIIASIDDIFARIRDVRITNEEIFTDLYRNKKTAKEKWEDFNSYTMLPNECCQISHAITGKYALAIFKNGAFHLIHKPEKKSDTNRQSIGDIFPDNDEQALAYALLIDPSIDVVALAGDAGTGKTLFALLAGVELVKKKFYEQILVLRPTIEIGQSLGYLKGSLEEKFAPWEKPVWDNLKVIFKCRRKNFQENKDEKTKEQAALQYFVDSEKIDISPILHMRGQTIHDSFVIIDDAQNLTPGETETILARAGDRTKMVLTGDIRQIDNIHLDAMSNGIVHTIASFKGDEHFGHITLLKVRRSTIAEMVSRLMKK